ncbi:MAG: hypothetical protein ACRDQ5_14610 [Sciscionella sp.]
MHPEQHAAGQSAEVSVAEQTVAEQVWPAPLPGPPPGGAQAIPSAMASLDGLDELPVTEHVARFDAVHVVLTEALSSIDKV